MIAAAEGKYGFDNHTDGKPFGEGPHVVDHIDPESGEGAVLLEGQFALVKTVPGVAAVADHMLDAVLGPLDRTAAEFFCQ